MIELVIASRNQGKIREMTDILRECSCHIHVQASSVLGSKHKVIENGVSFPENARIKALYHSGLVEHCCLGEDSGLEVAALGGSPGIFSARFAGADAGDRKNINKLLAKMSGVADRRARFVCAVCLASNKKIVAEFVAVIDGLIAESRRGNNGFGYDPIFFYPPLGKMFAEMSSAEKNAITHRAQAIRRAGEYLCHTWRSNGIEELHP
jgi:XTP/dITP diphosphohydrolase